MKKINFFTKLLKRYLEKHGFFVEFPSVDQNKNILDRIPKADLEDYIELNAISDSNLIYDVLNSDNLDDYEPPLCVICKEEVDTSHDSYWFTSDPENEDSKQYIHAKKECLFHPHAASIYELLITCDSIKYEHRK